MKTVIRESNNERIILERINFIGVIDSIFVVPSTSEFKMLGITIDELLFKSGVEFVSICKKYKK